MSELDSMTVRTRTNPCGSESGRCAETANVAAGAYVDNLACVFDHAEVSGRLEDEAQAAGHSKVFGLLANQALSAGHAIVRGTVRDDAIVFGNAEIQAGALVNGHACVGGDVLIPSRAEVGGNALILSRYGYMHGAIGGETWDAYTSWREETGWYVTVRIACKALASTCWEKESNVAAHAADIDWNKQAFWQEAIEHIVEMVKVGVMVPKCDAKTEALPSRRNV